MIFQTNTLMASMRPAFVRAYLHAPSHCRYTLKQIYFRIKEKYSILLKSKGKKAHNFVWIESVWSHQEVILGIIYGIHYKVYITFLYEHDLLCHTLTRARKWWSIFECDTIFFAIRSFPFLLRIHAHFFALSRTLPLSIYLSLSANPFLYINDIKRVQFPTCIWFVCVY